MTGLLLIALIGASASAQTDVLDRIAAVINNKTIITASDVRRERAILLALGKEAKSDDMVLQNLIDRHLVEEQIALFPGIEVTEEAVQQRLAQIRNGNNLTAEELRKAVFEEIRLSEFIIQRFRQFIRITDEEVSDFYEKTFVPAARQKDIVIPPLNAVADDIRREIAGQKLDNEVRTWLDGLRSRNDIEIFQ